MRFKWYFYVAQLFVMVALISAAFFVGRASGLNSAQRKIDTLENARKSAEKNSVYSEARVHFAGQDAENDSAVK
jgi:hypothetical protein